MPVLRPSGSDFTSFVKAAAQYVPAGGGGKVSKSGGVPVALPGLGAVVRTSQVGALASPSTSAVIINGITPPPAGGGAAPPFVPTSVSGCKMWFDTFDASYTLSGTTVTSWTNKSGNADATPQGSGNSIVNQAYLNGKSSIRFAANPGTSLRMTAPLTYSTIYRNMFVVATLSENHANYIMGDSISGYFYSFRGDIEIVKSGTVGLAIAEGSVGNATILISASMSSGGNTGIWVNGTSKTLTTNIPAQGFLSAGSSTPRIGNTGEVTTQQYDMYEMLQYDGEITTTQRQQIEGYLAWKWGIQASLPAGHPFKTAAPV